MIHGIIRQMLIAMRIWQNSPTGHPAGLFSVLYGMLYPMISSAFALYLPSPTVARSVPLSPARTISSASP